MDSRNKHIFTEVRLVRPARRLTRLEARRIVERQAAKLLRLREAFEAPIPEEVISHLPRIEVHRSHSLGSLSGICHWEGSHWRITVNARHALVRQRFTIAHEFAHVLDAPFRRVANRDIAEELADYFAASVLMPKRLIKRAWGEGIQDTVALARLFNVSAKAMRWRIDELRLEDVEATSKRRTRQPQLTAHYEGTSHEYPLAY
jgi:Zn-dependent peptidase ImmA (M78 family)